jgi:hypothetical protein
MERFELLTPTDFPNLRHIVHGRMVPVTDPLATATRLVEVRLNMASYDFIRTQALYTVAMVSTAPWRGARSNFRQVPCSSRPAGAHCRRRAPRYHTLTVHLADGRKRLFGLAALNIAAKTGHGWLWASFEHTRCTVAGQGPIACVGTQTTYLDAEHLPVRLGNAVLEAGSGGQRVVHDLPCPRHLERRGREPSRLPVFAPAPPGVRRGYVGTPSPAWFGHVRCPGTVANASFASLDFRLVAVAGRRARACGVAPMRIPTLLLRTCCLAALALSVRGSRRRQWRVTAPAPGHPPQRRPAASSASSSGPVPIRRIADTGQTAGGPDEPTVQRRCQLGDRRLQRRRGHLLDHHHQSGQRIIRCSTLLSGFYLDNGTRHSVSDRQGVTIFPGKQSSAGRWVGMDQTAGATYKVTCRAVS